MAAPLSIRLLAAGQMRSQVRVDAVPCHVRSRDQWRMLLPARNRGTPTGCETPVWTFALRTQTIRSVASTGQHFPPRNGTTRFAVPQDRAGCIGPWAFWRWLQTDAAVGRRRTRARGLSRGTDVTVDSPAVASGLGTCTVWITARLPASVCPMDAGLRRTLYSSPRTTSTGTGEVRITCSAPLPSNTLPRPLRPWVPTTIRSAFHSRA